MSLNFVISGKYVNHKGRGRSFTSPEELAREQKDMQNKRNAKKNVSQLLHY